MEAPVLLPVGVGLVTGVDDRPLVHGVEADFDLEEVGALGDLELAWRGVVLGQHLAGPAENLPRHEKRNDVLGDELERDPSVHEVVFVIAVRIALLIGVVPVDDKCPARRERDVGVAATDVYDALSGLLVVDELDDGRALGCRKLRMGVVHIETRPVDEHLVELDVLGVAWDLELLFDLEPAGVGIRVLLLVVPDDVGRGLVAVDEENGVGDGVEVLFTHDGDAVFRLRSHDVVGQPHEKPFRSVEGAEL